MARSTSSADRVALPRVRSSAVRLATPLLSRGSSVAPASTDARAMTIGMPGPLRDEDDDPVRQREPRPSRGCRGCRRARGRGQRLGTGRRGQRRDGSGQDDALHGGQTHGGIIPAPPSPARPTARAYRSSSARTGAKASRLSRVFGSSQSCTWLMPSRAYARSSSARRSGGPARGSKVQCAGSGGDARRPRRHVDEHGDRAAERRRVAPRLAACGVDPVPERRHARGTVLRGGEVRVPQVAVPGQQRQHPFPGRPDQDRWAAGPGPPGAELALAGLVILADEVDLAVAKQPMDDAQPLLEPAHPVIEGVPERPVLRLVPARARPRGSGGLPRSPRWCRPASPGTRGCGTTCRRRAARSPRERSPPRWRR